MQRPGGHGSAMSTRYASGSEKKVDIFIWALPYIEWVNIQMLATEVTENTEIFSFVGAASAANSSRSDGLFAAEAAPTFTVVQTKTTKQAFVAGYVLA